MDESKEREAFERATAHIGLNYERAGLARKEDGCTYWQADTEAAWCAWKATRAALAQPEPEPEQWKVVDEWAGGCRLRRVQPEPEHKGMKLECRIVERGADYMTISVTAKDAEPEPELSALLGPTKGEAKRIFEQCEGDPFRFAQVLADRKRREE